MAQQSTFLDKIGVAEPCTQSWNGMQGDERVRYCGECRLRVYNLSAMSRREAEDLVRNREGRLCVKFFRRADGTLVTDECGRVRRALRRKALVLRAAAAALFGLVLTPLLAACGAGGEKPAPGGAEPAVPGPVGQPVPESGLQPASGVEPGSVPAHMLGRIALPQPEPEEPRELMGDVCMPEELLQPDPPVAPEK